MRRSLTKICAALCAGCLSLVAAAQGTERYKAVMAARMCPAFLHQGDTVAIITPSYAPKEADVLKAVELIRSWGYEVVTGPNMGKEYAGPYAGTAEERLSDLRWALSDPSIKAIICQRGGYGTIHMVGDLRPEEFVSYPKWLVGYSDITTLHALSTKGGVMSIHGPMGNSIAAGDGVSPDCQVLRRLLAGQVPGYRIPPHRCDIPGEGSGTLVGGNLCTFSPLAGTEADFPQGEDLIIFIEEVEESYHNIDRLFNMLVKRGVMDRVKGVILGDFTGCRADLEFDSVEDMLRGYLQPYGIPVCCGLHAGHDDINLPLVMGAHTTLKVTSSGASLTFDTKGMHRLVNTGYIE